MAPSPDGTVLCPECGTHHRTLPLAFHAPAPALWSDDLAGTPGCQLSSDLCIVHGRYFFLKGLIEVPVAEHLATFEWGVWVSLSASDFRIALEQWQRPGRETAPPARGWLMTDLPGFAEPTLHQPVRVHTQPVGLRPLVVLTRPGHPLAVQQHDGITREQLERLVGGLLAEAPAAAPPADAAPADDGPPPTPRDGPAT